MKSKDMEKSQKNADFQSAKNPYSVPRWNGVTGGEPEEEVQQTLRTLQRNAEISKAIDIQLLEDKKKWDKRAKAVKIILLGALMF